MKASNTLISTLAAYLFSSHPERGRDRQAQGWKSKKIDEVAKKRKKQKIMKDGVEGGELKG